MADKELSPVRINFDTFAHFAISAPLRTWSFQPSRQNADGIIQGTILNPARGRRNYVAPPGYEKVAFQFDFSFSPVLRQFIDGHLKVSPQRGSAPTVEFKGEKVAALLTEILERGVCYLRRSDGMFRNMPSDIREALNAPEYRPPPSRFKATLAAISRWLGF